MRAAARRIHNVKLVSATVASRKREGDLAEHRVPLRGHGVTKEAEFHVEDRNKAASPEKLGGLGAVLLLRAASSAWPARSEAFAPSGKLMRLS